MSESQKSTLMDFMERHGDLSNPLKTARGRVDGNKLWEELSGLLNADGQGPVKSVDRWKKTWADLKSKTKKKASLSNLSAKKTGGGPSSVPPLTDTDERIITLIGDQAISGGTIEESGFQDVAMEITLSEEIYHDHNYAPGTDDDGAPSTAAQPAPSTEAQPTPSTSDNVRHSERSGRSEPPQQPPRRQKRRRVEDSPFDIAVDHYRQSTEAANSIEQSRLENERLRLQNEAQSLNNDTQRLRLFERALNIIERLEPHIVHLLNK